MFYILLTINKRTNYNNKVNRTDDEQKYCTLICPTPDNTNRQTDKQICRCYHRPPRPPELLPPPNDELLEPALPLAAAAARALLSAIMRVTSACRVCAAATNAAELPVLTAEVMLLSVAVLTTRGYRKCMRFRRYRISAPCLCRWKGEDGRWPAPVPE